MPLFGLYPFLLERFLNPDRVSMPVSMPLFGLHPFLLVSITIWIKLDFMCQCPYSGSIHFHDLRSQVQTQTVYSVNALHRAPSISTCTCYLPMLWHRNVSMPLFGLHPFLLMKDTIPSKHTNDVSMSSIGLHPFLRYPPEVP